jgi:hypothetical protein
MLQQKKRIAPCIPLPLARSNEIRMEVVFGTPSQNCIGSGICMVMNRLPRLHALHCPHAPALVSCAKNALVFRFFKSDIQHDDARARFAGPWFPVQEAFTIPRHFARRLGLASEWISPGLYRIEETAKEWLLVFNVDTK